MRPSPGGAGAGPERRAAPRTKVFLLGAVTSDDGAEIRAHMLDVSTSGARLDAKQAPVVGARMGVRFEGVDAIGRVAWVTGDRFGVAFD